MSAPLPQATPSGRAGAAGAMPRPRHPVPAAAVERPCETDRALAKKLLVAQSLSLLGDGFSAAEVAATQQLEAEALAENTRKSYLGHLAGYVGWCRSRGIDPLAATPDQVAVHLARYAVRFDAAGHPELDADGVMVPAVAAVSVTIRRAAIDKLFRLHGQSPPGATERVRRVLAGIRRTYKVRALYARAALDPERLSRVLDVIGAATARALRDRVLLLLLARTGASPGQLARLRWDDLRIDDGGVEVALPPGGGGRGRRVHVPAHLDAAVCLRESLLRYRRATAGTGALAAGPDGTAMSRPAVYKLLDRLHGGYPPTGSARQTDAALRRTLPPLDRSEGPIAARDRAVLLAGFWGALRRSELAALTWADVTAAPAGWTLLLRVSKGDQEGIGATVPLPRSPGNRLCAADALDRWRVELTRLLGRDPLGTPLPLFASLDRHGNLKPGPGGAHRPLRGGDINDLVKRLALAAGLVAPPLPRDSRGRQRNPYGGHSMRVGFIVHARRMGVPPTAVAKHTRHQSVNMVMRYDRLEDAERVAMLRRLAG